MEFDWVKAIILFLAWLSAVYFGYELGARHAIRNEIKSLKRLQEKLDRALPDSLED